MADQPPADEQLRRLKNTVMGAAHRLSLLDRSDGFPADAAGELESIIQQLNDAVARLERLLTGLRRDR
jgi:hypothetical protein